MTVRVKKAKHRNRALTNKRTGSLAPAALAVSEARLYWNATPISASLRHTRRQGRLIPSNGNASVKRSGTTHGLTMSNAAPVSESLRTKHKTVRP
jgi:hypothetical protein